MNDRKILSDFLDGAKQKKSFYDRMVFTPHLDSDTTSAILAEKWQTLSQSEGMQIDEINFPIVTGLSEELQDLLKIPVIPVSGTQFSTFINKVGNADWIRQGQHYIHDETCPFCQQLFDATGFSEELKKMFDASYQDSIDTLNNFAESIARVCDNYIEFERRLATHKFVSEDSLVISLAKSLNKGFKILLQQTLSKVKEPSQIIHAESIQDSIIQLGNEVLVINLKIRENNRLAANFSQEKKNLNAEVMGHLRKICNEFFVNRDKQLEELSQEILEKKMI